MISPVATSQSSFCRMAVADFNLDGKLDIAYDARSVFMMLGNGAGSFVGNGSVVLPLSIGVAAGDLDSDGLPDVVATNDTAGLALLLNAGGGALFPPVALPDANRPTDVAIADLDGNGMNDIVAANGQLSDVSVLLASAPASFLPTVTYSEPSVTYSVIRNIRIADIDADGILDVATSAHYDDGALLRFGTGSGALGAPLRLPTNSNGAGAFGIADLNQDGVLDFVVGDFGSLTIYLAAGPGSFTTYTNWFPTSAMTLAAGDFNEDGRVDAAESLYSIGISIYLGSPGAPSFNRPTPTRPGRCRATCARPTSPATATSTS